MFSITNLTLFTKELSVRVKSEFSTFLPMKICDTAKVVDKPKPLHIPQNVLDILLERNYDF
jgi:hypothetical protein